MKLIFSPNVKKSSSLWSHLPRRGAFCGIGSHFCGRHRCGIYIYIHCNAEKKRTLIFNNRIQHIMLLRKFSIYIYQKFYVDSNIYFSSSFKCYGYFLEASNFQMYDGIGNQNKHECLLNLWTSRLLSILDKILSMTIEHLLILFVRFRGKYIIATLKNVRYSVFL